MASYGNTAGRRYARRRTETGGEEGFTQDAGRVTVALSMSTVHSRCLATIEVTPSSTGQPETPSRTRGNRRCAGGMPC